MRILRSCSSSPFRISTLRSPACDQCVASICQSWLIDDHSRLWSVAFDTVKAADVVAVFES